MKTVPFEINASKTVKGVFYADDLGVPDVYSHAFERSTPPLKNGEVLRVSYTLSTPRADSPEEWALQGTKILFDDCPKMDLWKASKGITQRVDYVVQPHFKPGFKQHLRIRMKDRPPLGQMIRFRPSGAVYTIIQVVDNLPANEIRYCYLDRPLEEAVTAVDYGGDYVVEQWFDAGMFESNLMVNGGLVCGVSLLDENLQTLMLS